MENKDNDHKDNESTSGHSSEQMGVYSEQLDSGRVPSDRVRFANVRDVLGHWQGDWGQRDSAFAGFLYNEDQGTTSSDEEDSWDSEDAFGEGQRDFSPSSYILQEGRGLRGDGRSPWGQSHHQLYAGAASRRGDFYRGREELGVGYDQPCDGFRQVYQVHREDALSQVPEDSEDEAKSGSNLGKDRNRQD